MNKQEWTKKIETIKQKIKQLKEKYTTLIRTTNKHQTSLKFQDLIELQDKLNTLSKAPIGAFGFR